MSETATPTEAIDAAEAAVREQLDALVDGLHDLVERAKEARSNASRLTAVKERGEMIERELRNTHERLLNGGVRPPDEAAGEKVDEELAEKVRAKRNGKPVEAAP